jgi:HD-GYP domain-containing protein (c-di-GMP phosphodiesterase class II)
MSSAQKRPPLAEDLPADAQKIEQLLAENKQAQELLRKRLTALQTLAENNRKIIANTELQIVLDLICDSTIQLLSVPKVAILLYDMNDDAHVVAHRGMNEPGKIEAEFTRRMRAEPAVVDGEKQEIVARGDSFPDDSVIGFFRLVEGVEAYLKLPLVADEWHIGALLVLDVVPRQWEEEEIHTLRLFADQAAIALQKANLFEEIHSQGRENSRLYEAEQQRTIFLAALQRLGIELATLHEERSVLDTLAFRAATQMGNYDCAVVLSDPAESYVVLSAQFGLPEGTALGTHLSLSSPPLQNALATGEPFFSTDIHRDLPDLERIYHPEAQAIFIYPMMWQTIATGFIGLSSPTAHMPSPEEITAFQLLAERAAAALENARLFEETQHRAEELHARNLELARLYRASGPLISSVILDTQAMAQAIVDTVWKEFGQANCSLVLVQEDSQDLVRLVVSGPYADQLNRGKLSLQGQGLVPKAIRTGQVINVPDVSQAPDYLGNWPAARSELTIPLKIGSGVIGAIDLQSKDLNAFNASDEHLMTIFAERAALALSNARLYEQTMRSLQRLTAFRTIDQAISSSMDLRVTLNILLEQVTAQLGVDAAAILLYNAESQILEYAAVRGFRSRRIEHTRLHLSEGNAGRVALERRPIQMIVIPEMAETVISHQLFFGEQFLSYYGLPLIAKGQLRGVLEIMHRSVITPDQDWLDFLETLARQAAIALESVALFENLQRSNSELTLAYDAAIEGWSQALELRYTFQKGHAERTAEMTVRLGRALRVGEADLVHARRGALLHDIGEIAIPDSILNKKGALTEEEWVIVRQHPMYAFELLSPIRYLQLAADIPHCHHERWDGMGYPRGLAGDQIPLLARIFAVADTWDALTSARPHRPPWTKEAARTHIREQAQKCFDPSVVETFLTLPDL